MSGLRRMVGVELDLRNVGLKLWRTRPLEKKENRMGSRPDGSKDLTHMAVVLKKKNSQRPTQEYNKVMFNI